MNEWILGGLCWSIILGTFYRQPKKPAHSWDAGYEVINAPHITIPVKMVIA